jgi:hypothetical protein
MVKQKVTAKPLVKALNLTDGATLNFATNGNKLVSGSCVAKFVKDNAADLQANVVVETTPLFDSLGITAENWANTAKIAGMFAASTTTRANQLRCWLFGVQLPKDGIPSNKSKAFDKLKWEPVAGGKTASRRLNHINVAIKATGGKVAESTALIGEGNTLLMLLNGTNTTKDRSKFFYGKSLVQLVVKPITVMASKA